MSDDQEKLMETGYEEALGLLGRCASEHGFLASPSETANYRRVWGRDGSIVSLAALASGEDELVDAARRTLETLLEYQGPHGEIPSNVDPVSGRISYGGTTGRVDADLWFLIAFAEYWKATGDDDFVDHHLRAVERVCFLLGAWEFNDRGLLFVPPTGDWADEYLQHGYVLYDQLLYLQVHRSMAAIHRAVHSTEDHGLVEHANRLYHLVRTNYWFADGPDADVYHPVLYEKASEAPQCSSKRYWLPFFGPTGYGYRFDAFANVLASLLGVADDEQRESVDDHVDDILPEELPLLPAFHPVIRPVDEDWEDLQMTFSYSFKNRPHEYHNGGLWPLITGFYVADLARRGCDDRAHRCLAALHRANRLEMEGEPWSFPEYVHGTELDARGTRHLGWSAGAAVLGHHALRGTPVLRIGEVDGSHGD